MGKGARLKQARKQQAGTLQERYARLMTKNVQKEILNSEMWDQMVAEFGEEKARQLLKTIKAEVKSNTGS